jgi:polynucleotide 5'-hydroxyl-kinase GRC3/NOL9
MSALYVPPEWEHLDLKSLTGTLMVVGAPDVGKSTFARYLFKRFCAIFPRVAYLDGDPGQSTLGPPGTMTLALSENEDDTFPPRDRIWRSFVGSVSPAGHMLPVLTSAARLTGAARDAGAQLIVYDTTGLVDPTRGGIYLKLAKIDLLRPTVLLAIQREQELNSLLLPLRRSQRVKLIELTPPLAAQRRDLSVRRAHRAAQFADHFANSFQLRLSWPQFAVLPAPRFSLHRLLALEDVDGFAIGLGIVKQIDRISKQVVLHTSVASTKGVDAIRLGNVAVDPETYEDRPLNRGN